MDKNTDFPLDELAAMAVRLGRELERGARAASLGGNASECGFVSRTLRRLSERDPFDLRDDSSLAALEGIIAADLRSEIRGSERRFCETRYDASGQDGEVRDCPIYSERGEQIVAVQRTFLRFMEARAQTLDRKPPPVERKLGWIGGRQRTSRSRSYVGNIRNTTNEPQAT